MLFVLPLVGVFGIVLPLEFNQYSLLVLGLYLAIPMIAVFPIYLRYHEGIYRQIKLNVSSFRFTVALFFLLYIASIIILMIVDVRPIIYYIIIAFAAAVILFEIMLFDVSGTRAIIIMAQIMGLALNIIWGVSLKYYYFIGRTDILVHASLADELLKNGYVTDIFEVYQPFALWHILSDYLLMVTGMAIPSYKMMFIICGLLYSILPVFVYLITNKLFKDQRIALLSALFLSFYPFFLNMGMSSISRSIVPIFVLSIILLSLDKYSTKKFILAVILTFAILVFHTVSILFVLLILLAIYLIQRFHIKSKERSVLSLKYFMMATAITIAYWVVMANQLLFQVTSNLLGAAPSGTLTSTIYDLPLNELINYAQYSILLIFIFAGIILILRSRGMNNNVKVFSIIALILIPLTFPGPMLLINKFTHNFSIDRFAEYGFIFISLVTAYGFSEMFQKSGRYAKAALSVLFIILVLLSISNDFVASDNPLIKREFYTYYLTENEINGMAHLHDMTDGHVMADYVALRYMTNSPYSLKSHILEVDDQNQTLLRYDDTDVILIRESEFDNRPLKLRANPDNEFKLNPNWGPLIYYYRTDAIEDSIGKFNRVYDSGDVSGLN